LEAIDHGLDLLLSCLLTQMVDMSNLK